MTIAAVGIYSTSGFATLFAFFVLVIVMPEVLGRCALFMLAIDTHRRPGHLEREHDYQQYEHKAFHHRKIVLAIGLAGNLNADQT